MADGSAGFGTTSPKGTLASGGHGLPAEVVALLADAQAVVGVVGDAHEWTAQVRREVLAALDRAGGALTAARAQLLSAERDAGTWALKGDRDFAAWVGRTSRQGRGAGFAQAGQAATLAAMPAVADALVDGPVTPGHVQQLTRATLTSPLLAAELSTDAGQARLVELAGRLDAVAFGKHLVQQAAALDPASRQREHDRQRAARFLQVSHTSGGTLIKGKLDRVAGDIFQRAIDALDPRPAADDERDRGQRQADSLTTMSRRILADKATTPGSVAPPQVTLVVREETWAALRERRPETAPETGGITPRSPSSGPAHKPSAGSAADAIARLRGVAPVGDEDGNVWPASEVARVLCEDRISRVVMSAAGTVLDEGRSTRLFTPAQRLAIVARDGGGCAYPGCTMPARYTELHHLTWWDRDGGPTDVANGCQLCSFHHHQVHRHDIRIIRAGPGRYAFAYADGRLVPGSDLSDSTNETPPRQPTTAALHLSGTAPGPSGTAPPDPFGVGPPGPSGTTPPGPARRQSSAHPRGPGSLRTARVPRTGRAPRVAHDQAPA